MAETDSDQVESFTDQYDPLVGHASTIWGTQLLTFGLVLQMWNDMRGLSGIGEPTALLVMILGIVVFAFPMIVAAYRTIRGGSE
ncbi:hypothetical protein [Natronorubrum halophilum]|uniref:hypothetical protein n=1 Tax=Natronorubrum halophilum TaxID=1702106 RepID=UPI000EF74F54|nr:hypothetical protein [Natronorubrum halophilum]